MNPTGLRTITNLSWVPSLIQSTKQITFWWFSTIWNSWMNWLLLWSKMIKNKLSNKISTLSSTDTYSMESRLKWNKTTSTSIIQLLSQCIKKYSSMLPKTIRPIESLYKTIESPTAIPWISILFINKFSSNFSKMTIILMRKKTRTTLTMLLSCIWVIQTVRSSISSFLILWQNCKNTSNFSLSCKIQEKMVNLVKKPKKWSSPKFIYRM